MIRHQTIQSNQIYLHRHWAIVICLSSLIVAGTAAQEDLNERYSFPVSIAAEYQMLTPFGSEAGGYNALEAAVSARMPLPGLPRLQPLARVGFMQFSGTSAETERWSHTHYYGGVGVAWANRVDKTFELAAEASLGASEAVFTDLVPELGMIGSFNLYAELGARISLDPSYNLAIDIHPNLKWIQSLSQLQDFSGPVFGIGFALNYRFGVDPDSPEAIIRSLRISEVELPDVFAAMQSYYVDNPIGTVVVENTDRSAVTGLDLSFEQKGFMDSPTFCASIESLEPGESAEVDVFATYNSMVFTTEGTTPLSGEIIATYTTRGRPAEQRATVSYLLRDKTNMTWTDDNKVAAFITDEDSAVRNYASWVRQAGKDHTIAALSSPLQTAMQMYSALTELGCLYQTDPRKPAFEDVQGSPQIIDSVSLPRDTLARTTGDCDDLTVLYCALLESVGIDTGFVTVPGHIYAAFNTGVSVGDFRQVHPDRSMTLTVGDELWVPVEITLIGTQGFMAAWRRGIDEWLQYAEGPDRGTLYITNEAQATYWPVGLQQTDLGLQYGNDQIIAEEFRQELGALSDAIVSDYAAQAESGRKQDLNRLGIAYSRLEQYNPAVNAFEAALLVDPDYLSARVNLANVEFLRGSYDRAISMYGSVHEELEERGQGESRLAAQVLLNVSRAQYELEQFAVAREVYARAEEIDATAVSDFAYIGGSDLGRASQQIAPSILFFGEDD